VQPLFGGGGGEGEGDRENHARRRRDEIDSRCDAGEYSRERSTRHDWRKRNEGVGVAGRRVGLLRGARAIIVRRCKKFWIPERGVALSNTCLDEHRRCPRTTKCLVEGNFEKLNR